MRSSWIVFVLIAFHSVGQTVESDSLLSEMLAKDPLVDQVINNQESYRFQFMYSEVDDSNSLEINTINGSTGEYFYPASLVKLPTALATLEILNENGLTLDDYIVLEKDQSCGSNKFISLTHTQKLTFRKIIEELMVVSDNNYYNILYHFITPNILNEKLKSKGYTSTNIYRCFSGCEKEDQLKTNEFRVYNSSDSLLYTKGQSSMDWHDVHELFESTEDKLIGERVAKHGKVVYGPYDFNYNLEYPLVDLHQTMIDLIYPDQVSENQRWNIRPSDRDYLLKCMSMFPRESLNSKYHNKSKYPDNEFKIIAFGDQNQVRPHVKTYSKIGYSYGFIAETAFVLDTVTNTSFFLTMAMYVNKNGTINDGRYEFATIATPFMGRFTNLLFEIIEEQNEK